jgi:hypothetical protein
MKGSDPMNKLITANLAISRSKFLISRALAWLQVYRR